jgi:TatD DNase family protein
MYQLIDTHAHLEEIEDLEKVLEDARQSGVVAIVAVGSDMASNQKVLQIAESHKGFVYPALGWHPWNLKESQIDANLAFIESHVNEAVAIGEIGLDYHKKVRAVADKELQHKVLGELLGIARRHGKPALIHSRYAWRDALDAVVTASVEKAVFHWYTGTSSVLRDIIARGYYISATPAIEYHEEHRRAAKEAPLDRLLLETDSPVTYGRGSASEFEARPVDVVRSLRGAALLKGLTEPELAGITTQNARGLFGFDFSVV